MERHSITPCLPFQSDSSVTITCANGKWNKQISCEPVDCGLPDKYHVHPAHFMFPEGTTYGKKSTFQCREPAQLVGEIHIWTRVRRGLLFSKEIFCSTWLVCLCVGLYEKFQRSLNQIFMKKLLAWLWQIIKAFKQMNLHVISLTRRK